MYRKILLTFCIFYLLIISICTYSIAATEGTNKVKNAVMNTGNIIGNTAASAANGVMNMTEDMVNGAATLGNDTVNGLDNISISTMDIDFSKKYRNEGVWETYNTIYPDIIVSKKVKARKVTQNYFNDSKETKGVFHAC